MKTILIGIDPDTVQSGIAILDKPSKSFHLKLMTFFQLFDYLKSCPYKSDLKVFIEAGWLNKKANFHDKEGQTKQAGERIGKNVGANHETGRKIVEMLRYLEIEFELVEPMGKVTPAFFRSMTGIQTKNQDLIDAGCLIWGR